MHNEEKNGSGEREGLKGLKGPVHNYARRIS